MTDSSTQSPPFSGGGRGAYGHIGWTDPKIAVPKSKTLEFENLSCTYNLADKTFTVVTNANETITFSEESLDELRAAIATFGIGLTPLGGTVNYR